MVMYKVTHLVAKEENFVTHLPVLDAHVVILH